MHDLNVSLRIERKFMLEVIDQWKQAEKLIIGNC